VEGTNDCNRPWAAKERSLKRKKKKRKKKERKKKKRKKRKKKEEEEEERKEDGKTKEGMFQSHIWGGSTSVCGAAQERDRRGSPF
jgi:hypothetical protein